MKYEEIAPGCFREEGFSRSDLRLSDPAFVEAAAAMVYLCTDTVLYHLATDGPVWLDLACRNIDPAFGQWWVCGGRVLPGEELVGAALRHLKDDTSLVPEVERLEMLPLFPPQQYLWANGKGGFSNHVMAITFALEIKPDELATAKANLRSTEYQAEQGIQAFNRDRLIREGVHPGIMRIYDTLSRVVMGH